MVHREAAQDIILLSQKTLLCIFIEYMLHFDSSLSLPLSLSVSLCVSGSLFVSVSNLSGRFSWSETFHVCACCLLLLY